MTTLLLLPCPACERVTALTVEVSPSSRLRCPHCGGEFSFSTLFRQPGDVQWQVVGSGSGRDTAVGSKTNDEQAESANSRTLNMDDPTAKTLVDALGEYEGLKLEPTASQLDDGEDFHLESLDPSLTSADATASLRDESDSLQDANETLATARKTDWSSFQPPSGLPSGRRRRKQQSSPVWSILQVALGGLAAIPIALMLVWHVIGTDVADAGPWVGRYAPWIVPEKFRPYQSLTAPESRIPTPASSGLPSAGGLPEASPTVDKQLVDENITDPPQQSATDGIPVHSEPRPATAESTLGVSPAAAQAPTEIELNAPLLSNVFAMIRQANEHLDEWTVAKQTVAKQSEKVDLGTLAKTTYANLTNLALAIDKLPQTTSLMRPVRKQLGVLGKQVSDKDDVKRLVIDESRAWVNAQSLAEDSSKGYGLAMIFIVEQAEKVADAQDQWWKVVPTNKSSLGEPPLEIRIPFDVALSLSADQIVSHKLMYLLGMVRPQSETSENERGSAPGSSVFVASYALELYQ